MNALEAAQADEDNFAVVVVTPWGRPAGEAGIGRLKDHDAPAPDGGLQDTPLFDKGTGTDDCGNRAAAVPESARVAARVAVGCQDMLGADNANEVADQHRTGRHPLRPVADRKTWLGYGCLI